MEQTPLPIKKTRKRVNLSLTPELYGQLAALSAVKGKEPAKFAREILSDYFAKHAEEIRAAQTAGETYQQTIAEIRLSAASPEHAARQESLD